MSDRADTGGTAPARVVSWSGALIARAPKYRQSAAVKMKAEPPRLAAGGSMAQWLAESWAPSGGAAAAAANLLYEFSIAAKKDAKHTKNKKGKVILLRSTASFNFSGS